ncbi:hypothetical protein DYB37_008812 [Aphanomyces astaci]|uniref:Uncharacterized protein n=1 Tax=Aphanomyces astaci TaxID=112090 RepID=A0A397FHR1_APHAT|nr:hypothetical protein DYB34_006391 [Aphanomyces astaci]RHZ11907.1 hypothetical protein DYB37_008812 [Aphanomyces astaci]RHZ28052.1 hypothetical protein DYB31_008406 [Aphanomyces astaci]
MYIGPWQEYKLAKIQDAAVQKLRKEWEDHLKSTIIGQGDEECIRQMMEPILSKLPAMLLANRSKEATPPATHRKSRRSLLTGRSIPSNQDLPNHEPGDVVVAPTKKQPHKAPTKKKPKAPVITSIDEVARRKQRWTAPASVPVDPPPTATTSRREETRLPPVTLPVAASHAIPLGPPAASVRPPPVHLPTIETTLSTSAQPEVDEDSLDEDELNSFLHWTDQLSHPDAELDEFLSNG